jgi:DNA-binding LacI/PurR family transcriptional regulator
MCTLDVRPTAILGLNNTMAVGALRGLIARNISIPEDISIASYNNIDNKELMVVRPTVHGIDSREIGLLAGKALLERLENRNIPRREIMLGGSLIPGNTVSIPYDFYPLQAARTVVKITGADNSTKR